STFGISRRRPPGTAGVDALPGTSDNALVLEAVPNPSGGTLRFSWHGAVLHGSAIITLYDLAGREVGGCEAEGGEEKVLCAVRGLPAGMYVAQLRCGERMATTTIVLR